MRLIKRRISVIVLLFLLLLILSLSYHCLFRFSLMAQNYYDKSALSALKRNIFSHSLLQATDFYSGNFTTNNIPDIKNKHHHNVIWLGSLNHFEHRKLSQYDYILTSTIHLRHFLKENGLSGYFFPPFIEKKDYSPAFCAFHPQEKQCFYAVIGHQPEILAYLEAQHILYKYYPKLSNDAIQTLSGLFDHLSGIIVNDSTALDNTMDTHPFFLYAVAHQIPILSDNVLTEKGMNVQNFNLTALFADTLSYYSYKSDIENFINCHECRLKKAEQAKLMLDYLYTDHVAAQNMAYILKKHQEPFLHLKDVINIIPPTHAGLYNNGDYWLAKDMENAFAKINKQAFSSFALSAYPVFGDVAIYLRGTTPVLENKKHAGVVSLMYLIFPFTDKINAKDYALSMQTEFGNVDAVAVASVQVADEAAKNGVKAYYVPQFTNSAKFYPDYQKNLQSEVLFVGQNDYYRKAARWIYDAGLPITIYGPKWDGLAKAEYIDNKILRKYYSSAKIVLNDTRPDMRQLGFISNRIFDATACGTLVISDYMKEIEDIYGDSVPMWKTEEELIELVKYYLDPEHEAERKEKAERAREITLKNFTADIAAQKFMDIIDGIKKEKEL